MFEWNGNDLRTKDFDRVIGQWNEIDRWSPERRSQYQQGGASIANNEAIADSIDTGERRP